MEDLPFIEAHDEVEADQAEQLLALLASFGEAGDRLSDLSWHLLGRFAYYSVGAAAGAVDALLHDANDMMDHDMLEPMSDALNRILPFLARAVGEPPGD